MYNPEQAEGFALAELGAVVAVVALTVILTLVAARRERSAMWDAVDAESLSRFAEATTAYAADNGDVYWTFSWRMGMDLPTDYPDLKDRNTTDTVAAAAQAVDILRRKAGREDIPPIESWFPQPFYSHLALYDYLNQEMPGLWGVCPADRHRLAWAQDPAGFDQGVFLPCQPTPGGSAKRWPYSSSYELSTSFYDHGPPIDRIRQAGTFNTFIIPGSAELHGQEMRRTAFPSQKVHLFERERHHLSEGSGPECDEAIPFIVPDSRIACLFADGHLGWMMTSEANPGWQPENPNSPGATLIPYGDEVYPGVYRWTREFIGGRNFGGPEVGPPP